MFKVTYLSDQKLICEGQRQASCLTQFLLAPLIFCLLPLWAIVIHWLGHIILQILGTVILLVIFGFIVHQVEQFLTWHRYVFNKNSGWLRVNNWCRIPFTVLPLTEIVDVVLENGQHIRYENDSEGHTQVRYEPYRQLKLLCAHRPAYVLDYESGASVDARTLHLMNALEDVVANAEAQLVATGQITPEMRQRQQLLDGIVSLRLFLELPKSES